MSIHSGNNRNQYNSNQDQRNYVNLNEVYSGNKVASYKGSRNSDAGSVFSEGPLPQQYITPAVNQSATLPEQNGNNLYTPRSSIRSNRSLLDDNSKYGQKKIRPNFLQKNKAENAGLAPISEDIMDVSVADAIKLCSHFNTDVSSNALAYLQHRTYKDNAYKLNVYNNNGISTILEQTSNPNTQIALTALGLLKNMSYSDDTQIAKEIERLGGIQKMTSLIEIHSNQIHTNMKPGSSEYCRELAVDVLWNLSSMNDVKPAIQREALQPLIKYVLLKDCQLMKEKTGNFVPISEEFDIYWSTALANSLGIIRNINYELQETRNRLRNEDGLVDCLLYILQSIPTLSEEEISERIDGKIVENTTCILRNLTYSIQEIVDKSYLNMIENKNSLSNGNHNTSNGGGKIGTFGRSGKKGFMSRNSESDKHTTTHIPTPASTGVPKGVELLWDSAMMASSLFNIVNFSCGVVTLEASCGVIQNLTAGYWEPSANMREKIRDQELLKPLIELIQLGTAEVIRSAATALRNSSQEPKSCQVLRDMGLKKFVEQLPDLRNNKPKSIMNGEDDTDEVSNSSPTSVAAILSLIYAVIKDSPQYICYFVEYGGANRCVLLRNSSQYTDKRPYNPYPHKVSNFAQCILNLIRKTPNAYKLALDKWKLTSNHFVEPHPNRKSPSTNIRSNNVQTLNLEDDDDKKMQMMMSNNGNNMGGANMDDIGQPFVTNPGLQQRSSVARSATGSVKRDRLSSAQGNQNSGYYGYDEPNFPRSNNYYNRNSGQTSRASNNYQHAPIAADQSEYPGQPPRYSSNFDQRISTSERGIIPTSTDKLHSNKPPSVVNGTPRGSIAASTYSRTGVSGKSPFGPQFQPNSAHKYRTSIASSIISNQPHRPMPQIPTRNNRNSTTSSVGSEYIQQYSLPNKPMTSVNSHTRPIKTSTNSVGRNSYHLEMSPTKQNVTQRKDSDKDSWV